MRLRLLALVCAVFLIGAGFGFYEAHAASGIKYDGYLSGKNVSKVSGDFLGGYAAGTYDTLQMVTYIGNEATKYFTPETFTKQFVCLQKIPSAGETVAFAKPYWDKEPDVWAAQEIIWHACEYSASARSNAMTKGGGTRTHVPGGNSITLK